jgi:hypothetical protein
LKAASPQDDHQLLETTEWLLKLEKSFCNDMRLTVRETEDDCGISVVSCDAIISPKTTRKMAGWLLDPKPRKCARTHFTSSTGRFIMYAGITIIQGVSKRALQLRKLIEIYTDDIHKVLNSQNVAKHTEFYLG